MSPIRRETGHAILETLFLGLVLLVPVIWMLTVFSELHAAALATSSAARESGFEAARSVDVDAADRGLARSVSAAVIDHGLDPRRARFTWSPPRGWRRGGPVEVVVTYRVSVFQVPFLGAVSEPSIPVTATHVTSIDRYRSRPD